MTTLNAEQTFGMKTLIDDGNLYIDTKSIPWTAWVIPGMWFKLLNVEGERCSLVVKIEKGTTLAIHRHLEPVEFFVLEGSFGYIDEDTGKEHLVKDMGYLYEPPGTVHRPVSPDGCFGFAVLHGKIQGFDDKGNEVELGTAEYVRRAKENNAISHIPGYA